MVTANAQASKPATTHTASASNVYPVQDGFVDANGVMIYYKMLGRGAPLMIVHGGPGASHDYFLPYLLPLARRNKVIFIDERGSGRSQKLEDLVRLHHREHGGRRRDGAASAWLGQD